MQLSMEWIEPRSSRTSAYLIFGVLHVFRHLSSPSYNVCSPRYHQNSEIPKHWHFEIFNALIFGGRPRAWLLCVDPHLRVYAHPALMAEFELFQSIFLCGQFVYCVDLIGAFFRTPADLRRSILATSPLFFKGARRSIATWHTP